jgi:DNA-binding transcriptional LysR family regulator
MLNDIKIFIQVAGLNSFSKAAKKLNLAPPIVTRHIAKLEKELGVKLFHRSTRLVSLTEAGKLFYENAPQLLDIYHRSVKQIKSFGKEIVGDLKVGLPHAISHLHVIPALPKLLKKHPNLNVEIVTGNHLLDFLSSGFDVIIHCGNLQDSNFYAKKLGEWSKITCASPAYFKQNKTPEAPFDLKHHVCLDHFDNHHGQWMYWVDGKSEAISIDGKIQVNSSLDLRQAALAGMGIIYLPSFVVNKDLKCGQLKPLLEKYQAPKLPMYAVYPSKQYLSAKTKAFMDFLGSLSLTD